MQKTITHQTLATWLTVTALTLLCVNPGITQGEDCKNLLLIAAMCVSPAVFLMRGARVFIPRVDIPLSAVCVLVLAGPLIFHPSTIRWITMLFTCACCVWFMVVARLLRMSRMTPELLCGMIRTIVYAFAVVLVIQQLCRLFGLPIFMEGGMIYAQSPFKLNSLTAEPSHTTVTLTMLMFTFTQTCRHLDSKERLIVNLRNNPALWLCWAWTVFSTDNASAYVLSPVIFTPWLTRRNVVWWVGGGLVVIAVIFWANTERLHQLDRVKKTAIAFVTLDEEAMIEADASSSARIVPTLRGAKEIDFTDTDTYVGHGVDADQRDIAPRPCDLKQRGFAGLFCISYNYGLICGLAFWTAIGFATLRRHPWTTWLTFLYALQLSADHNMQLVWMIMALGMTFKYTVCGSRKLLDIYGKDS